jgi:site-specific DNA-methyltransferase (adenine-specific)
MWVYGSGFPKSHNIGKAIDKIEGNEREVLGTSKGKGYSSIQEKNLEHGNRPYVDGLPYEKADRTLTKGNSDWEGWGTALKPAHEPIVMARKPLSEKSIAENVLKHGTGGINIDGSRISHNEPIKVMKAQEGGNKVFGQSGRYEETTELKPEGRWPANIIFDEEAGQLLGEPSRFFYCPKAAKKDRNEGLEEFEDRPSQLNSGGIGRKISVEKRLEENGENAPTMKNNHPTVKPTDLMRYLINLVTPPNGTTLDPFMGSGSTGKAAVRCGVNFIGIEREQEYMDIASARINHELNKEENAKK